MYTYNYEYGSAAQGLAAALIVFVIIMAIIGLAVAIMTIIGLWKVFKKSGEDGWKAIIPVYNMYILMKITGVKTYWLLILVIASVIGSVLPILSFLTSIVGIYLGVIMAVSTAKSFGKDTGFAVGLYFLGPIFYLILGCGSATYQGKKPMEDPVTAFIDKNILKKETTTTTEQPVAQPVQTQAPASETTQATSTGRFCSSCGKEITDNSPFCTGCGRKVE